jgi:hypothetical protein
MEVSIPINFINQQNVYFVEKKNNIIVEGNFIKVIYSTDSFEMNGVYIAIDIAKNSGFTDECGRGLIRSASQAVETDAAASSVFRMQDVDKSWIQIINKQLHNREIANYSAKTYICDASVNSRSVRGLIAGEDLYLKVNAAIRTIEIERQDKKIDTSRNIKKTIWIDSNLRENRLLIEKLCKFEYDILKRYIDENCLKKTATYILRNQLMTNTIKYNSENKEFGKKPNNIERCILKVSGVWETTTNVGITMKFTFVY